MIKYLILFLLPSLGLWAQAKYFETALNWYPTTANQNGMKIFEQNGNQYIIGSLVNNYTPFFWNNCTVKVDKNGQLTEVLEYQADSLLFSGAGLHDMQKTDYGYITIGFVNDNDPSSLLNNLLYIIRMNEEGQLIDQTTLPQYSIQNYNNSGYGICRTPDSGYLVCGYSGMQDWASPYLCKLNADLEVEWDTLYEQYTNLFSRMLRIKPAKDGNGYWAIANINTTYEEGDIALLRLDELGNIVEEHVYGAPNKKELTWKFIETLDDEFAFVVTRLVGPSASNYMGGMVKTDNTSNIAWANLNAIRFIDGGVLQMPDSSFIVSGGYIKDIPPYDLDTQISKFSPSGTLLWTRHYGNAGNDYIYDMILDSEGSLVFCGRDEDTLLPNVVNGANLYLLKTNCMGLLTEPQANFSASMDTALLTATFQNLSQFVYPDSIDGGHFVWDFGDGSPLVQQTATLALPLQHTYAQGGNYTVRLTAVVCSDTSVFVQNVSTWAVGISAPLNDHSASLNDPPAPLFTVSPNPAQDYLLINNLSSAQNATFVLYDVLGQTISATTLSGNSTQIATEQLPSGVYLYQIINPQKHVLQYGKVSIIE